MRYGKQLAAVPALALLVALTFSTGSPGQTAPLPNLAVTAFGGPACAEIGQVIGGQITITETNNGTAAIPPPPPVAPGEQPCPPGTQETTCSSIGFYISTDATITTSDTLLFGGRENLYSELGAGVAFNVGDTIIDFLLASASVDSGSPLGNVFLGVIVDEGGTVTESNEADNTAAVPIVIVAAGSGGCDGLLPDLVVDSFTHEPAQPTTADGIVLTAVVKNAGNVKAGASVACIDVGGEICTNPTAEMLSDVPALAAGETFAVVRSVDLEVAQNYINNAVADVDDDVFESNEGNNTASDSFTVSEAPQPVALVYQVVSLPTHGTLEGLDACSLDFPCDLPSVKVSYAPDEGFVGNDSFEFQVFDPRTGLTSVQAASIGIFVANALDLFDTPLTIDFLGSGHGDVAMDIGGTVVAICDDDCTKQFGDGQIVKLQARPIEEYTFGGWGGACVVEPLNSQVATITLPSQGATCTVTFGP